MTAKKILPLAALLAAGWFMPAPSPAQDKKDAKGAAYETKSAPGEGQKFLEKFVGEWTAVKTFHRGDKSSSTEGSCTQTMIHSGRFLRSEFVFGSGDSKTTGTGLIGFETKTGLFTSVWTDSRATRMSFRQGQEKFDGKEIVLHSVTLDAGSAPREGRKSRTVTRLEDEGNRIVHRQYNAGEDGKERVFMEILMTRKSAGK